MAKQTDYLVELLDKVRAVLACGVGTQSELARYVNPDGGSVAARIQVNRWIGGEVKPNGESTLRIQSWLAVKTLEIDAAGDEMKAKYRAEFKKTESGAKK